MPSHKLYRILDGLYNSPQLITESALKPIVEYLQQRNSPEFALVPDAKTSEEKKAEQVGGIGSIVISGAITYQPVNGLCGPTGTSYKGILEQAQELIDSGVHTILMTIASPGGQAAHCFSTCEELREMCTEAEVKLISYVDEQAASAALALSVVADEVIIHPSASTGSVGCVCCVVDQSKALDKAGIRPIFVSSTPGKTPFAMDGSFSEEFLKTLQEDVTELGLQFAQHVSKHTGLLVEDILAMDAKMFRGEKAVEAGLANKVMDHKQFVKYMTEQQGVKK